MHKDKNNDDVIQKLNDRIRDKNKTLRNNIT